MGGLGCWWGWWDGCYCEILGVGVVAMINETIPLCFICKISGPWRIIGI